jgi:hypothetical protein
VKDLGGGEWRAMLAHEAAGPVEAPHYEVAHCVTGEARFARRNGPARQEVAAGDADAEPGGEPAHAARPAVRVPGRQRET